MSPSIIAVVTQEQHAVPQTSFEEKSRLPGGKLHAFKVGGSYPSLQQRFRGGSVRSRSSPEIPLSKKVVGKRGLADE
jgi:hypothetical protein